MMIEIAGTYRGGGVGLSEDYTECIMPSVAILEGPVSSAANGGRMLQFWVSLLLAVILTNGCYTFAQSRTGNVIQFKLENYGWQALPKEQGGEWVGTRSRLVSIDHQGRVLVAFTTRANQSLASREHPGLSFHILRFTPEGKVDLSLALPTNNLFNSGLYQGSDDHIYARFNDALQFLSEEPDARNAGGVWQTLAPCSMNCVFMQSPSRRTLILREFQEPDHHTYTVLDTSSAFPRAIKSCPWIGFHGELITDQFGYLTGNGISIDARRWPLCDQHETELPLDMRSGLISPLSDEAFLLLGTGGMDRRGIDLVSQNGQLRFHYEMPKHDIVGGLVWPPARSDERGDRFAFTVETRRGGSRALDISAKRIARRVLVFTETGEQLATVTLNTNYHVRNFDFSMSPDGHRLAMLDDGVVTVVNMQ
jgi:hypothetical protein